MRRIRILLFFILVFVFATVVGIGANAAEIHDNSDKAMYYNIDNGTTYFVTTRRGTCEVKKGAESIAEKELSTVGTYDITRVEEGTKFIQKVVLYKNGDVNESNGVDCKDWMAMKKLVAGIGTKGLAGTYAADINRSGSIDDTDVRALGYSLFGIADLQKTKGDSVLNGIMPITGFDGPYYDESKNLDFVTEDVYDMVKDLGFNTVLANRNQIGTSYDKSSKQLQLAEERGIKVYLYDAYVSDEENEHGITQMPGRLTKITAKYDGYDSFGGYYIYDEPLYSMLDNIDTPLTRLQSYTNINSYVNLFPYISGLLNGQLGGSDTEPTTYDRYKMYVEKASRIGAQVLSYDMYLRGNGVETTTWWGQTKRTYKIHTRDFYTNLDWMRDIVAAQGKSFQAFVQVGTDYGSGNKQSTNCADLTTVQEMYLEANVALAMGARGIQYYSLIQPIEYAKNSDGTYDYYRAGLINAKGEANNGVGGANYEYYNAAKKINTYIAKIDEVLMHATSKAVIATDGTTAGYLSKTGAVNTYDSVASVTGTKALVGCFDYYGKEAYMVVNTTPDVGGTGSSQTITLTFDGAKSGKYIAMGAEGWTDMSSAIQLSLEVPAGESFLVVLD